jgi:hypothetical protein
MIFATHSLLIYVTNIQKLYVLLDRSALQYSVQKLENVIPLPMGEIKIRAPYLPQVVLHSLAFTVV